MPLSGYYVWKKQAEEERTKEDREKDDVALVRANVAYHRNKDGYRSVTMRLRMKGFVMNHKKVQRIMRKYHLQSEIRRKDPYRVFQRAKQEHLTAPNLMNREFRSFVPYRKLGTDITYVAYRGKWAYLSIVKDMATGEILSWSVSLSPNLELVAETLERLGTRFRKQELQGALLQSDQGFQYTHESFSRSLKSLGCIQSMSRRGNCLDNAPTESFFGHMKDETDASVCKTLQELEEYFAGYIHYYNYSRPQWTKKKMTPVQYRNHLLKTNPNT